MKFRVFLAIELDFEDVDNVEVAGELLSEMSVDEIIEASQNQGNIVEIADIEEV